MFSLPSKYRLLFSIFLLSASIIAFQLALMQILSIVQWNHFAYMIISVALLGFGAAGTALAVFKKAFTKKVDGLLPVLMIGCGITMVLGSGLTQSPFFSFDSYLLFVENRQIIKLLFTYLLFFIPFFLGALAIGLVFLSQVHQIGKIYFANLAGSGAGGILALILIWNFFPKELPGLISILPVLAGIIMFPQGNRLLHAGFAIMAFIFTGWKIIDPPALTSSQYKDISKTLLLPEARIILEKTSPYGLVQAVTSPVLRYAPGLSLAAQTTAKTKIALFVNGNWFGAVTDWKRSDTTMIFDFTTSALPYVMAKRNSVLVLNSGSGPDLAYAITKGVNNIVAAEPNTGVVSVLKNELALSSDSLFYQPQLLLHNLEPRTFLLMDTSKFDLVNFPTIGVFGGSTGLSAVQENFLLTKEAFRECWIKLNHGGAISVNCWLDYPLRTPLKILATIVETLEDSGIKDPEQHLAAIRSWGTICFVMTRSPLKDHEIQNIRAFCERMMFDPVILPGIAPEERTQYNEFQDNRFFDYVDSLLSPARNNFYRDYDFNIEPATDEKPFFSQFLKRKGMNSLAGFFGNQALPFFELGYFLVIITLLQISIVALILIILPLFKLGWKGKDKLEIIVYFTGIGLGYMFVEMVFIQRFILYFGNPVYSASAVIFCLLVFSGIGSYTFDFLPWIRKYLMHIFIFIICLLFAYSFILTPLLRQTVHLPIGYKLITLVLLVAPLAFLMGIPFPSGLSRVSDSNVSAIPWAWGINGCISVISTALAVLIAVELGFMWVMVIAAISYALPLVVQLMWRYKQASK